MILIWGISINLQNCYFPWELEEEIKKFADYYNKHRYHESLNNLTPDDVYYGRSQKIISMREHIKEKTMKSRESQNLNNNFMKKSFEIINTIP